MRMTPIWIPALALALCVGALPVAAQESKDSEEETSVWTQVLALYKQARDAGETVSEDVYEWARDDLETIGDWEYKVKYFPNANHIALEKKLNELGADRWEVVWIDRQGANLIVTLKRPSRTWLNKLPLGELIKLAAPSGGE